jgi:hypothetical protein
MLSLDMLVRGNAQACLDLLLLHWLGRPFRSGFLFGVVWFGVGGCSHAERCGQQDGDYFFHSNSLNGLVSPLKESDVGRRADASGKGRSKN